MCCYVLALPCILSCCLPASSSEPTSGLDSHAAALVMRSVRKMAGSGRTVVCTIHQPSQDIFQASREMRDAAAVQRTHIQPSNGTRPPIVWSHVADML